MSIWKTLKDGKPDWRVGPVLVLTRGKKIKSAWWFEHENRFYTAIGIVRPITNYWRWCYEHELIEQALNEINS